MQWFYFITLYNVQTDRIGWVLLPWHTKANPIGNSFVVRCHTSREGRPRLGTCRCQGAGRPQERRTCILGAVGGFWFLFIRNTLILIAVICGVSLSIRYHFAVKRVLKARLLSHTKLNNHHRLHQITHSYFSLVLLSWAWAFLLVSARLSLVLQGFFHS